MANLDTNQVPEITVPALSFIPTVIEPIIHTLLFNRNLSNVEPVDVYNNELGFSYPAISCRELTGAIQQQIAEFVKWMRRRKANSGTVRIAFHDRPIRKRGYLAEERIQSCFEEWFVPIQIFQSDLTQSRTHLQNQVKLAMEYVLSRIIFSSLSLPVVHSLVDTFEISAVADNKTKQVLISIKKTIGDISMPSILRN